MWPILGKVPMNLPNTVCVGSVKKLRKTTERVVGLCDEMPLVLLLASWPGNQALLFAPDGSVIYFFTKYEHLFARSSSFFLLQF